MIFKAEFDTVSQNFSSNFKLKLHQNFC